MKRLIMGVSSGIAFLLFLILTCVINMLGKAQTDQAAASRWSEEKSVAQVSCFFSVNSGITQDRIQEFEHSIDGALTDASVTLDSTNPSARLWADAYSANGRITISSDRATMEAEAIGIGGDFFLFHPLKLLSGAYFSGNDVMTDYCVIDQDAAWQLFGSNDVAGEIVYISGIPHVITGVVERPEGKLYEAAGLEGSCVYVSYETLNQYGVNNGINHYEILMPNPVTDFAYSYVKEQLGTDEKETEVVENSNRYSLPERLRRLPKFGTRSMNGKAIIYPYWENVARGYEDILGVLTLFEMLAFLVGLGFGSTLLVILWKGKGWTIREKWLLLKDKTERTMERSRDKNISRKRIRKEHDELRKTYDIERKKKKRKELSRDAENIPEDKSESDKNENPVGRTDGIGEKTREDRKDTIKLNDEEDWL